MKLLFAAVTGFLTVFLVYPLLVSFGRVVDLERTLPLLKLLTEGGEFQVLLFTSLNIALAVTLLSCIIALPAAYYLNKYSHPRWLSLLLLSPLILPPFVSAIGIRRLFARFGPVNLILLDYNILPIDWLGPDWLGQGSVVAIVLTEALHLYPLFLLTLGSAFKQLDPAAEEAAIVSGAGPIRIFRAITLPLLLPALFSGSILVWISSLTDLGTPLIFEFREVLPVAIFNRLDEAATNPTPYLLVLILLLITITAYLLNQHLSDLFSTPTLAAKPSRSRKRVTPPLSVAALFYILVVPLLVVSLLPHLMIILTSLGENWFFTPLPESLSLKGYMELPTHPLVALGFANSLLLSSISTAIDLILGLSVCYLLYRTTLKYRRALEIASLSPLVIPGVVLAFSYLQAFRDTPLDPTKGAAALLCIGYAIRRLPFMVRTVTGGFSQLHPSLEEAAYISGSGRLRTFRKITAPLLLPFILSGAVLCFAFAILEVSESLILAQSEGSYPITKVMYMVLARPDGLKLASAIGVAAMLLLMVAFYLAKRFEEWRRV